MSSVLLMKRRMRMKMKMRKRILSYSFRPRSMSLLSCSFCSRKRMMTRCSCYRKSMMNCCYVKELSTVPVMMTTLTVCCTPE